MNNHISDNSRNNTITGGLGNDILSGGGGTDSFVFDTTLNASTNNDAITDFNVAHDIISLDNAIFTKLTPSSIFTAGNFVSGLGAVALDSDDFLIYDTTDGSLITMPTAMALAQK